MEVDPIHHHPRQVCKYNSSLHLKAIAGSKNILKDVKFTEIAIPIGAPSLPVEKRC